MHQVHNGLYTLPGCSFRTPAYVPCNATKTGPQRPTEKRFKMAYATHTQDVAVSFADRIVALRDTFAEYSQKRAIYRRTINELGALSNRELADLGLSRSGIRRVALEAAQLV